MRAGCFEKDRFLTIYQVDWTKMGLRIIQSANIQLGGVEGAHFTNGWYKTWKGATRICVGGLEESWWGL